MTAPENGPSPNTSDATAANPCAPLRKSTGRVATNTRAFAGTDHARVVEARTARSTSLNSAMSVPDATRTTAPAILISMTVAVGADTVGLAASVTIGTNAGEASRFSADGAAITSIRVWRRQPNTCCGQICQLRATSETRAPATSLSATFPSADQQRADLASFGRPHLCHTNPASFFGARRR
jgi:hypothetical protein